MWLREPFKFELEGVSYELGMELWDNDNDPNTPVPDGTNGKGHSRAILMADGEMVVSRSYTWQENYDEEKYFTRAVEVANDYLDTHHDLSTEGPDNRSFGDLIAAYFLERLVLVGNQLEIK